VAKWRSGEVAKPNSNGRPELVEINQTRPPELEAALGPRCRPRVVPVAVVGHVRGAMRQLGGDFEVRKDA
jgi:hypothetical protein